MRGEFVCVLLDAGCCCRIPHCSPDHSQWSLCSTQLESNTIPWHISTIVSACRSIPFEWAILHNECRGFWCVCVCLVLFPRVVVLSGLYSFLTLLMWLLVWKIWHCNQWWEDAEFLLANEQYKVAFYYYYCYYISLDIITNAHFNVHNGTMFSTIYEPQYIIIIVELKD